MTRVRAPSINVNELFDQVERFFTDTAIGTHPVIGNIFPTRAGRDAVLGIALGFVINMSANDTFPLRHRESLPRSVQPTE
jgi:hypothetical protein